MQVKTVIDEYASHSSDGEHLAKTSAGQDLLRPASDTSSLKKQSETDGKVVHNRMWQPWQTNVGKPKPTTQ